MSRAPAPLPTPLPRLDERLLDALEAIYRDLEQEIQRLGASCEACGECCHLADYGHELWLTDYELAYLVRSCGARPVAIPGVCPYLERERCTAREGRALSCRIFHCGLDREAQERLHEAYLERLSDSVRDGGGEIGFGELLASLAEVAAPQAGISPRTKV